MFMSSILSKMVGVKLVKSLEGRKCSQGKECVPGSCGLEWLLTILPFKKTSGK